MNDMIDFRDQRIEDLRAHIKRLEDQAVVDALLIGQLREEIEMLQSTIDTQRDALLRIKKEREL